MNRLLPKTLLILLKLITNGFTIVDTVHGKRVYSVYYMGPTGYMFGIGEIRGKNSSAN